MPTARKKQVKKANWWSVLRQALQVRSEAVDRDKVRRTITIISCLVVSLLFWFTLKMNELYRYELSMRAQVAVPKGYTLSDPLPEFVRLEVQGTGWQLLQLLREPPVLRVDASRERTLDLEQTFQTRDMPNGIAFVKIQPKTAQIKLAKQSSRWIPVVFRGSISTAPSFDLRGKPYFTPQFIKVSGPEHVVQNIKAMPIKTMEQTDLIQTTTLKATLSDTLSGLIQLNQTEVNITFPIEQFTEVTRRIPIQAIGLPSNISNVQFKPSVLDVVYRIPLSQHDTSLQAKSFTATVSYKDMLADSTRGLVIPTLHLPKDLTIRDIRFSPRRLQYYFVLTETN